MDVAKPLTDLKRNFDMNSTVRFPVGFRWGTATSAYQIEGAVKQDGRSASIWDRFCEIRGKIEDGTDGADACDHYRRFREDVRLMRDLGLQAYRFSIAWPRVMPDANGKVNERGLGFYDELVDELLRANIEPYATLYHWDLPQSLQDEGGWPARRTAIAFADYAEAVARRLGDRVQNWITVNEPWCVSFLSHLLGKHAPGLQDWSAALCASHHVLLAHGLAVQRLRAVAKNPRIGASLNLTPVQAASDSLEDRQAARFSDGAFNRWFLDPLYARGYPADVVAQLQKNQRMPENWTAIVQGQDLQTIAEATDFLGINYYFRTVARSEQIPEEQNAPRSIALAPQEEWTDMGWETYPDGLYDILQRVHRDYSPPCIYITENGASFDTGPDPDLRIQDTRRIKFLADHLLAAHRAIEAGVPLRGYFLWSLLDNFEWDRGYSQRFGIVWVDFKTQLRYPKDSAHWYSQVIARNALDVELR